LLCLNVSTVPVFCISSYFPFFWGGVGVLREKSPLGLALSISSYFPFWGLGSGAIFLALFMALFHKQNSAGENPLVRRVAQRAEGRGLNGMDVKRGPVGLSPSVIILNFTRGLPVYPDSRARAGRGVYIIATNYRHHHHLGKGLIALS
jgi:hypothetical protein